MSQDIRISRTGELPHLHRAYVRYKTYSPHARANTRGVFYEGDHPGGSNKLVTLQYVCSSRPAEYSGNARIRFTRQPRESAI